jgi:sugar phosphate isomerase/epimerase
MIRLGICNEIFEDWPLDQICQTVRELGYEGIELAPFTLASTINDLTFQDRSRIRATIRDAGLECIGLHWLLAKTVGFHLTSPDRAIRRATSRYLSDLAYATRDLGGTLMVLGSPKQRSLLPGVTADQAFEFAAEILKETCPALEESGVKLCVEPLTTAETDFLTSIGDALELMAMVNHPQITLQIDVKAQHGDTSGGTVAELWRRFGAKAGHAHANDVNLRGPGMGDVQFGPIIEALVASGYSGWLSVEPFDYSAGAKETARQSIECLREGLAACRELG